MDQPETVAHYRCMLCDRQPLREGGLTSARAHSRSAHGLPFSGGIVLLPPTVLPEPLPYEVPYDAS